MKPSEADVLRAIRKMERLTQEGWSISYARKKACGSPNNPINRLVTMHPSYQPILINYMIKKGFANQYLKRAHEMILK